MIVEMRYQCRSPETTMAIIRTLFEPIWGESYEERVDDRGRPIMEHIHLYNDYKDFLVMWQNIE